MWFMMGIAQLLIGNALLADEGTSDWIAYMIQGTGGGTMALGLYFLLFLARNESEFSELYSKAEKTILTTDPGDWEEENRGRLLQARESRLVLYPRRNHDLRDVPMAGYTWLVAIRVECNVL